MATQQETFDNSINISSLNASEIINGTLRSLTHSHCIDFEKVYSYPTQGDGIPCGSVLSTDDLCLAASEFTIIVWVRLDPQNPTASESSQYDEDINRPPSVILDKSNGSNGVHGYSLGLNPDASMRLAMNNVRHEPYTDIHSGQSNRIAGIDPQPTSAAVVAEDGLWHQIVWTAHQELLSGSTYRTFWTIYFDGKQFDYAQFDTGINQRLPPAITAPIEIGSRTGSNWPSTYVGKLRGVYIYNSRFNATEVAKSYYENYQPSSLVESWLFNETSGSTVASSSGNFDGTFSTGNPNTFASFFELPFSEPWSNTESNNIGGLMSSPSSIDSFSYTIESQPMGRNARVQFSSDGSDWKSNDGSIVPSGVYRFDGIDDYIDLGSSIDFAQSNWSFSCWFRSNAQSLRKYWDYPEHPEKLDQYIAGNRGTGGGLGSEDGWLVYIDKGNVLTQLSAIYETSGSYVMTQYKVDVCDGKWHHVSVTFDHSTQSLKVYLDGSIANEDLTVYTSGYVGEDQSTNNTMLGRSPDSNMPFEGDLCHPLFFTNHDLSASEIANIYKYHQIPSSNLANEYLFNGNANDNVGSANGTVTGAENYTGIEHIAPVGYSLKTSESYRFSDLESTGQEISIPHASQLNFGTGSLTLAVDINFGYRTLEEGGGWHGIVRKSDNYIYNTISGFGLTLDGGGGTNIGKRRFYFKIGDGTNTAILQPSRLFFGPEGMREADPSGSIIGGHTHTSIGQGVGSFCYPENTWKRVVCVADRDPSTNLMNIYVDGQKLPEETDCSAVNGLVSNSNNLIFGENFRHWRGKIANVAIWDEAKDENFIKGEFQSGYLDITGSPSLVGFWPLNGDADDKTSYANNGTVGSGSTDPISEIDLYRANGEPPSEQTVDLSSLALTDTVYYRIVTDSAQYQQYPISLSEVSFEYTSGGGGGGGGGGDPITGPTTKTLIFASSNGDEEIIAAPDANKSIVLLGATSSASCVLQETDASGLVIAYIPAGHSKFKAPIKVTSGTAVHVQGASNITLFFTRINS